VLWISYSIFGAFQIYFVMRVSSSRAWAVFATVYAAFLGVTLFVREDKFGATAWTCTLPTTRIDIVRARFVEAWVLVVTAIAGFTLLAAVVPGSRVSPWEVVEPRTLLMMSAVATLVLALMLPFTIRFGMLGVMIFLVAVQVLGVVVLLIVSRRGRTGGEPGLLRAGVSSIVNGIAALREILPAPVWFAGVLLALCLVNWIAFRLAVHLFRRREL
jgi:hypothetical protein